MLQENQPTATNIDQIKEEITEEIKNSISSLNPIGLIKFINKQKDQGLDAKKIEEKLKQEIFDIQNENLRTLQENYQDDITAEQQKKINYLQQKIDDFNNNPQKLIKELEFKMPIFSQFKENQRELIEQEKHCITKLLEANKNQRSELYINNLKLILSTITGNYNHSLVIEKKIYKNYYKKKEYIEQINQEMQNFSSSLNSIELIKFINNQKDQGLDTTQIEVKLKNEIFDIQNTHLKKFKRKYKDYITVEQQQQINYFQQKINNFNNNPQKAIKELEFKIPIFSQFKEEQRDLKEQEQYCKTKLLEAEGNQESESDINDLKNILSIIQKKYNKSLAKEQKIYTDYYTKNRNIHKIKRDIDNYSYSLSSIELIKFINNQKDQGLDVKQIEKKFKKEIFDIQNKNLRTLQENYKDYITAEQQQQINELQQKIDDFNNNPQKAIKELESKIPNLTKLKEVQRGFIKHKEYYTKKLLEAKENQASESDINYLQLSLLNLKNQYTSSIVEEKKIYIINQAINNSSFSLYPLELIKFINNQKDQGLDAKQIEKKLKKEIFDIQNKNLRTLQAKYKDYITAEQQKKINYLQQKIDDFNSNPQKAIKKLESKIPYLSKFKEVQREFIKQKEDCTKKLFEAQESQVSELDINDLKLILLEIKAGYNYSLEKEQKIYTDYYTKNKKIYEIKKEIKSYFVALNDIELIKFINNQKDQGLDLKQIEEKLKQEIFDIQNKNLRTLQENYKDYITAEQQQQINELQQRIDNFNKNPQKAIKKLESKIPNLTKLKEVQSNFLKHKEYYTKKLLEAKKNQASESDISYFELILSTLKNQYNSSIAEEPSRYTQYAMRSNKRYKIKEEINSYVDSFSSRELVKFVKNKKDQGLDLKQIEVKLKQEILDTASEGLSELKEDYKDYINEQQKKQINDLQKRINNYNKNPKLLIDAIEKHIIVSLEIESNKASTIKPKDSILGKEKNINHNQDPVSGKSVPKTSSKNLQKVVDPSFTRGNSANTMQAIGTKRKIEQQSGSAKQKDSSSKRKRTSKDSLDSSSKSQIRQQSVSAKRQNRSGCSSKSYKR